jgi:hypothetical protein
MGAKKGKAGKRKTEKKKGKKTKRQDDGRMSTFGAQPGPNQAVPSGKSMTPFSLLLARDPALTHASPHLPSPPPLPSASNSAVCDFFAAAALAHEIALGFLKLSYFVELDPFSRGPGSKLQKPT